MTGLPQFNSLLGHKISESGKNEDGPSSVPYSMSSQKYGQNFRSVYGPLSDVVVSKMGSSLPVERLADTGFYSLKLNKMIDSLRVPSVESGEKEENGSDFISRIIRNTSSAVYDEDRCPFHQSGLSFFNRLFYLRDSNTSTNSSVLSVIRCLNNAFVSRSVLYCEAQLKRQNPSKSRSIIFSNDLWLRTVQDMGADTVVKAVIEALSLPALQDKDLSVSLLELEETFFESYSRYSKINKMVWPKMKASKKMNGNVYGFRNPISMGNRHGATFIRKKDSFNNKNVNCVHGLVLSPSLIHMPIIGLDTFPNTSGKEDRALRYVYALTPSRLLVVVLNFKMERNQSQEGATIIVTDLKPALFWGKLNDSDEFEVTHSYNHGSKITVKTDFKNKETLNYDFLVNPNTSSILPGMLSSITKRMEKFVHKSQAPTVRSVFSQTMNSLDNIFSGATNLTITNNPLDERVKMVNQAIQLFNGNDHNAQIFKDIEEEEDEVSGTRGLEFLKNIEDFYETNREGFEDFVQTSVIGSPTDDAVELKALPTVKVNKASSLNNVWSIRGLRQMLISVSDNDEAFSIERGPVYMPLSFIRSAGVSITPPNCGDLQTFLGTIKSYFEKYFTNETSGINPYLLFFSANCDVPLLVFRSTLEIYGSSMKRMVSDIIKNKEEKLIGMINEVLDIEKIATNETLSRSKSPLTLASEIYGGNKVSAVKIVSILFNKSIAKLINNMALTGYLGTQRDAAIRDVRRMIDVWQLDEIRQLFERGVNPNQELQPNPSSFLVEALGMRKDLLGSEKTVNKIKSIFHVVIQAQGESPGVLWIDLYTNLVNGYNLTRIGRDGLRVNNTVDDNFGYMEDMRTICHATLLNLILCTEAVWSTKPTLFSSEQTLLWELVNLCALLHMQSIREFISIQSRWNIFLDKSQWGIGVFDATVSCTNTLTMFLCRIFSNNNYTPKASEYKRVVSILEKKLNMALLTGGKGRNLGQILYDDRGTGIVAEGAYFNSLSSSNHPDKFLVSSRVANMFKIDGTDNNLVVFNHSVIRETESLKVKEAMLPLTEVRISQSDDMDSFAGPWDYILSLDRDTVAKLASEFVAMVGVFFKTAGVITGDTTNKEEDEGGSDSDNSENSSFEFEDEPHTLIQQRSKKRKIFDNNGGNSDGEDEFDKNGGYTEGEGEVTEEEERFERLRKRRTQPGDVRDLDLDNNKALPDDNVQIVIAETPPELSIDTPTDILQITHFDGVKDTKNQKKRIFGYDLQEKTRLPREEDDIVDNYRLNKELQRREDRRNRERENDLKMVHQQQEQDGLVDQAIPSSKTDLESQTEGVKCQSNLSTTPHSPEPQEVIISQSSVDRSTLPVQVNAQMAPWTTSLQGLPTTTPSDIEYSHQPVSVIPLMAQPVSLLNIRDLESIPNELSTAQVVKIPIGTNTENNLFFNGLNSTTTVNTQLSRTPSASSELTRLSPRRPQNETLTFPKPIDETRSPLTFPSVQPQYHDIINKIVSDARDQFNQILNESQNHGHILSNKLDDLDTQTLTITKNLDNNQCRSEDLKLQLVNMEKTLSTVVRPSLASISDEIDEIEANRLKAISGAGASSELVTSVQDQSRETIFTIFKSLYDLNVNVEEQIRLLKKQTDEEFNDTDTSKFDDTLNIFNDIFDREFIQIIKDEKYIEIQENVENNGAGAVKPIDFGLISITRNRLINILERMRVIHNSIIRLNLNKELNNNIDQKIDDLAQNINQSLKYQNTVDQQMVSSQLQKIDELNKRLNDLTNANDRVRHERDDIILQQNQQLRDIQEKLKQKERIITQQTQLLIENQNRFSHDLRELLQHQQITLQSQLKNTVGDMWNMANNVVTQNRQEVETAAANTINQISREFMQQQQQRDEPTRVEILDKSLKNHRGIQQKLNDALNRSKYLKEMKALKSEEQLEKDVSEIYRDKKKTDLKIITPLYLSLMVRDWKNGCCRSKSSLAFYNDLCSLVSKVPNTRELVFACVTAKKCLYDEIFNIKETTDKRKILLEFEKRTPVKLNNLLNTIFMHDSAKVADIHILCSEAILDFTTNTTITGDDKLSSLFQMITSILLSAVLGIFNDIVDRPRLRSAIYDTIGILELFLSYAPTLNKKTMTGRMALPFLFFLWEIVMVHLSLYLSRITKLREGTRITGRGIFTGSACSITDDNIVLPSKIVDLLYVKSASETDIDDEDIKSENGDESTTRMQQDDIKSKATTPSAYYTKVYDFQVLDRALCEAEAKVRDTILVFDACTRPAMTYLSTKIDDPDKDVLDKINQGLPLIESIDNIMGSMHGDTYKVKALQNDIIASASMAAEYYATQTGVDTRHLRNNTMLGKPLDVVFSVPNQEEGSERDGRFLIPELYNTIGIQPIPDVEWLIYKLKTNIPNKEVESRFESLDKRQKLAIRSFVPPVAYLIKDSEKQHQQSLGNAKENTGGGLVGQLCNSITNNNNNSIYQKSGGVTLFDGTSETSPCNNFFLTFGNIEGVVNNTANLSSYRRSILKIIKNPTDFIKSHLPVSQKIGHGDASNSTTLFPAAALRKGRNITTKTNTATTSTSTISPLSSSLVSSTDPLKGMGLLYPNFTQDGFRVNTTGAGDMNLFRFGIGRDTQKDLCIINL